MFHFHTVEPSAAPYSYDDLFPALPESSQPKFQATNNKFRIGTTIITQVSSKSDET